MYKSFPPDVIVFDNDSLLHARLERGGKRPRVFNAKQYRLASNVFTPAPVTPSVSDEAAVAETVRRIRNDSGRLTAASVLLPDSWFRINLLDVGELPSNADEALELVRWALKRTLPIRPEDLRIAYRQIATTETGARLLVVTAVEATVATIERIFAAERIEVPLLESLGMNLWNAIAAGESASAGDRLFLYIRSNDFTTAVFRGDTPLFIRSRNLTAERTLEQELRLSASYLRSSLQTESFAQCYVAGNSVGRSIVELIGSEFDSPVRQVRIGEVADLTFEATGIEAELTACAGVFAA